MHRDMTLWKRFGLGLAHWHPPCTVNGLTLLTVEVSNEEQECRPW